MRASKRGFQLDNCGFLNLKIPDGIIRKMKNVTIIKSGLRLIHIESYEETSQFFFSEIEISNSNPL